MNNSNKDQNKKVRTNAVIFAIAMLVSQVGMSVTYALTFQINPDTLNVGAVVRTIGLAMLVVAGFGLVFSYMKRLVWSGVGFTFFITALCIELYPLINDFWAKTVINKPQTPIDFGTTTYYIYLSNSSLPSDQLYGNCITNAIKCALAVAVAFSSVLGRAGPLECFIATVFGTIGFELNRQVVANISVDGFGTYTIFTFGGFMGLALGLILKFKEDRTEGCSTERNVFNTSSVFSSSYALLGSLVVFTLFPILASEIDVVNNFNLFNLYNGPLSVVIGMGAAVVGAYCGSAFFNGQVGLRDIIHAPIAGGIVVGSASIFITNPVYALAAGYGAGIIQSVIQNTLESRQAVSKSMVSTISWSLFGVQGLVGGAVASGYKAIVDSYSNGIVYSNASSNNFNPGYQMLIAVISAGIGLGFGIISGLIIYPFSGHRSEDHFSDRTYWVKDNGISYPKSKQEKPEQKKPISIIKPSPAPKDPSIIKDPSTIKDNQQQPVEVEQLSEVIDIPEVIIDPDFDFDFEMEFSEASEVENNYHAYL